MKQTIPILGMSCGHCVEEVSQALNTLPEVQSVQVNLAENTAEIEVDNSLSLTRIQQAFATHAPRFRVGEAKPKTSDALSDSTTSTLEYYCPMYCEGKKTYSENIPCPVCGMDLVVKSTENGAQAHEAGIRSWRLRLIVGAVCTAVIMGIAMGPMLFTQLHFSAPFSIISQLLLSLPVVWYTGRPFFERGWQSLPNLRFNMFTLIALGSGVAWLYSLYVSWNHANYEQHTHLPLYFEATAMILTLAALGQYWEAKAYKKTQADLQQLLDLAPEETTVWVNGEFISVPRTQLQTGDLILVKAGERLAADGTVENGQSSIDTSALTGESLPHEVKEGDTVWAGTINQAGALQIRVSKIGAQTKMGQIVQLVQEAVSEKTPLQLQVDRVSRWFVPLVIGIAFLTFFYWWGIQHRLDLAFNFGIAVLIIACPCALGLATPMSLMVGLGSAARKGLLVQRAAALENLAEVDVLVLDKTGTLTQGKPIVQAVEWIQDKPEGIDSAIAALHAGSLHPLSLAILAHFKTDSANVLGFKNLPGLGVMAFWKEQPLAMGNATLCEYTGTDLPIALQEFAQHWQSKGATVSFVIYGTTAIGAIAFMDNLKSATRATLSALHAQGIDLVLLSGDDQRAVAYWADELHLTQALGNQMPDDKLKWIKQAQQQGKKVAMVGDGINDAPALTQAEVGLAIDQGSDMAVQTADIILLNGDIGNLEQAFYWSRRIRQNIRQNLFFAFIYNSLGIPIAAGVLYFALGWSMNPMWAAAAMSLSSLSVITNALRLRTA